MSVISNFKTEDPKPLGYPCLKRDCDGNVVLCITNREGTIVYVNNWDRGVGDYLINMPFDSWTDLEPGETITLQNR